MKTFNINVIIGLALILSLQSCQSKQEVSPPNFLFILVDDLGYKDVSAMGSDFYETPNIDTIAEQGTLFTNGYANASVCSPSRASLLTGVYPTAHGITDWIGAKYGEDWRSVGRHSKVLPADYVKHLDHELPTIPKVLKANGYTTFFAGKWHLGNEQNNSLPTDHGFDINKGGYEAGGPYSGGYFSPFNNPHLTDYPNERGMSLSMKLAKETSSFITTHKDQPFLAYLSFYAVHAPIQTSQEKWEKYRNKAATMGILEEGFEMERRLPIRIKQDNPVYAGLIEQMDDAVGEVLATLKQNGLDQNTVIVFVSDNGGVASGDNFSTSNKPLRGGKGYQWEAGVRVPYFIKVPSIKTPIKTIDTPVMGIDLFPTLLELAHIDIPESIQGKSLLPLLKAESFEERPLFWHYPHYGNQGGDPSSIIRKGNWKLIKYHEDQTLELYNLEEDLGETTDLSKNYPEITIELASHLDKWLAQTHAIFPKVDPLYDRELEEKWLQQRKETTKKRVEKTRANQLSSAFQPNENWWGSTVD